MTQVTPAMASRAISALALPFHVKSALIGAGYKHSTDLGGLSADDLVAELGISLQTAEHVLGTAILTAAAIEGIETSRGIQASPVKAATAAELLSTTARPRFSTFSYSLDRLIARHAPSSRGPSGPWEDDHATAEVLKGSILPGMSVEISGPPGSGKSAIATALAISARRAHLDQDVDPSETLIIDTEGAITPDGLCRAVEAVSKAEPISRSDILSGLHLVRIPTQVQMIAFLHTLDEWLDGHPDVKLVIFDTLSHHFRHPGMDMSARRRMMDLIKERIGRMTTVNRCAVVVMNQLATKMLNAENKPANFETGDRAILMPQLGDTWTHAKTLRIVLFRGGKGDDLRYAHASSAGGEEETPWAQFDVSLDGLPCDFPATV